MAPSFSTTVDIVLVPGAMVLTHHPCLPPWVQVKAKYEHKASFYSFGWSHGKESLEGRPDVAKGSYYANPLYDRPTEDERLIKDFAPFVHPNIWPTDDLPEMEQAFKALGRLIVDVGLLVARQCDVYVRSRCSTYPELRLYKIIRDSVCCKARLLHYFPLVDEKSAAGGAGAVDALDMSNWCGWHNDHGSLTGLTPALYLDPSHRPVSPNDDSGLYICSRSGEIVRATMPSNHLAFQIGETAQIHSGGVLQATPHAVKGSRSVGVTSLLCLVPS
jgi:isopenicillin N synthase-like dioxygenase